MGQKFYLIIVFIFLIFGAVFLFYVFDIVIKLLIKK